MACRKRKSDVKSRSPFLQFARNDYSQGGEDGILEEIFRLLDFSSLSSPFLVDIGAWDGIHLSNSRLLLKDGLWSALLLEADEDRSIQLKKLYSSNDKVSTACCLVDLRGDSSLRNVLTRNKVREDFEFLSVDVDGADYWLWESISPYFSPKVVCIEFNPSIPNDVVFVQEQDIRIQQGSSLAALEELGSCLGYSLVVTTTFNAIFCRSDLMHKLPEFDRRIDSLHSSSMITSFFQTYDGNIMLCGPKKLIWHKLAINPQQLQVLKKKKDRKFPFAPPMSDTLAEMYTHLDTFAAYVQGASGSIAAKRTAQLIRPSSFDKESSSSFERFIRSASSLFPLSHLEGLVMEVLEYSLQVLALHAAGGNDCLLITQWVTQLVGLITDRAEALQLLGRVEESTSLYERAFYLCVYFWKQTGTVPTEGISIAAQKLRSVHAREGRTLESSFWEVLVNFNFPAAQCREAGIAQLEEKKAELSRVLRKVRRVSAFRGNKTNEGEECAALTPETTGAVRGAEKKQEAISSRFPQSSTILGLVTPLTSFSLGLVAGCALAWALQKKRTSIH
jgi:hypothetical protein